jgi:hypothetical protein
MQPYPFLPSVTTLCAGFAASLFACNATAADVEAAHVLNLAINKSFGNFVFVKLDKPHAVPIACAINGSWQYTLPLSTEVDKRMFALLVTAQTTGKPVSINGAGACNEFGAVESMSALGLLP